MELSKIDPSDNDYQTWHIFFFLNMIFDFRSDNNHTVTIFSTAGDTILYLIGP